MKQSYPGHLIWIGFFLLFFFAGARTAAQDKVPKYWQRPNLLWQDTIWRYHAGPAQPGYFDAAFDDHQWLTVNEDFRDTLSSDHLLFPGIGVMRKKFYVPDSLRNQRMEFMILVHAGASEVYLDGNLIKRTGIVADNEKQEKVSFITWFTPQDKPVQIDLDSQSYHVLAVYYSNHNPVSFTKRVADFRGFTIMLTPLSTSGAYPDSIFNHPVISLCIILSFCLFFCFVYAFYPNRRASLFSILYLANFALIFLTYLIRDNTDNIHRYIIGDNIWRIGFSCNAGWNLLFLYSIYYTKMPKRSWIVVALMVLALFIAISSPAIQLKSLLAIIILLQLEAWRMLILGLRNKKQGFWILTIGMFVSLAGSFIAIFDTFHFFPWYLTNTQTVLAIVTDLSFPLTLALHLAWEFGSSNRDLSKKLLQVNQLSAKNLEQEQEKQQILATQNETLEQQVHERTNELEQSIVELKSAQAQLVQSEKMASLGQLTAGIAHEIQNPLNFVNNFSDINLELVDELKAEKSKVKTERSEAVENELLTDISQNMEKIKAHGKRADAIVKGMLEHSRSGSGQKQLTDINALAEEYMKLSFHGIRAKDASFNAKYTIDVDTSIQKINIVSQDIGRVLLNLYNNAFYAVNEKRKMGNEKYEPTVVVSTKQEGNKIFISVNDNGNGVPQNIIDKIFQPFFTTKPTGQGTGLGLSLAYDIAKAHGGKISVTSKEGEGTEFVIMLPVS